MVFLPIILLLYTIHITVKPSIVEPPRYGHNIMDVPLKGYLQGPKIWFPYTHI